MITKLEYDNTGEPLRVTFDGGEHWHTLAAVQTALREAATLRTELAQVRQELSYSRENNQRVAAWLRAQGKVVAG